MNRTWRSVVQSVWTRFETGSVWLLFEAWMRRWFLQSYKPSLSIVRFGRSGVGYAIDWTAVLIIRILYRLRTLSEQEPFDAATFSYTFPLLAQILTQGGVGVQSEDDPLEQVALALDIIKFHCAECTSCSECPGHLLIFDQPQSRALTSHESRRWRTCCI
jgi:hypothetical protein